MNFIIAGSTDIGNEKDTNQDSFNVKVMSTRLGRMVFAVVCDGMGGYAQGELASATVIHAFDEWVKKRLPVLIDTGKIEDFEIRTEWIELLIQQSYRINQYSKSIGAPVGTTCTAMLLTQNRYYIINIGDTRAYEITNQLKQITSDHTLVSQEIKNGLLTEAEAERDSRRSILLQGIGASDNIYPDMFFGPVLNNAVYMICSDGFRHEISGDEIRGELAPDRMLDAEGMEKNIQRLIDLNKRRNEKDNITCVTIRTF